MRTNGPGAPMSISRRRFLGMTAGLGAGLALTGCGTSPGPLTLDPGVFGSDPTYAGPRVELKFWNGFTGGDGPPMRKLLEQFNAEHDNISVSMNTQKWGDYYAKVPVAVAGGAAPDIAIMHVDALPTNAARGVVVPIDEMASALGMQESDFATSPWRAGVYRGKRYGIPLDVHPLGTYANSALLEKAGVAELPRDEATLQEANGRLKSAGVANPFWVTAMWPAHLIFASLIWQNGGDLWSPDGSEATFNSPQGVEALTWWVDQVKAGNSPASVSNDTQAIAFRNGTNAITWDGIWMVNEWDKAEGLQWAAGPLPQIFGQRTVWASSHQFVIPRRPDPDPNKLAAAKRLVGWISDNSLQWAAAGQVPARTSVRQSPGFKDYRWQSVLAEQIDYVRFPAAVAGIGEVITPSYELAVQAAVLGVKSPQAALDDAKPVADNLLAANLKKYGAA